LSSHGARQKRSSKSGIQTSTSCAVSSRRTGAPRDAQFIDVADCGFGSRSGPGPVSPTCETDSMRDEPQTLSLLADNLKLAAEECEQLARDPRRGFPYQPLRTALTQVAGCCEQLFYDPNYDARWLALGELT